MAQIQSDLSLVETIATEIPNWQIVENDEPTWNHQMSSQVMYLADQGMEKTLVLVYHVSRQGYSLEKILSTILIPAIQFDGKFILTMSLTSSTRDSSCILPIAYLIEAVNKSKILRKPIDLLLLDRSCEKSLQVLKRKSTTCKIYVGGDVDSATHLPLHLFSGVFMSTKRAKGAHFIVDSSADVQTAVEAISSNVWTLGTKVNRRARSLLFVHQAVHKAVIESVEKKMTQLKTGTDFTLKMVDFIKRPIQSILLPQGVKVFPQGSDLTVPTLVYDMGTSYDLIASPKSGYGHVLVVIPYRNTPELVSLSNNFDHQNQVFIYTSNLTFFKETTSQLNGKDIWSNTSQMKRETREKSINYALLKEDEINNKTTLPTASGQDKYLRMIQNGAEKSVKLWQSTSIEKRFEILEKVLSCLLKKEPSLSEEDRVQYFTMLIKSLSNTSISSNSQSNLSMKMCQSFGLVGILLLPAPFKLNLLTRIMPIFVSALKGNVTTIMYIDGGEDWGKSVQNSFESFLPPGVVNFIPFQTLAQAVQASGDQQSKFNLLWVIHDGNGVSMNQLSTFSGSRLIIDTQFTQISSLLLRGQQLELSKVIHM